MLTVIVVVHLMLVLALIGVVLLQKSEGGGLVSSGGSGFLTGRGTANVLTRTTALLAAGFFVTSLALSWLASFQRHPASIINTSGPVQESPGGPVSAPPLSQGSGGLLNQLQKGIPGLPAGPSAGGSAPAPAPSPAPSGPQVPQSQ